MHNVNPLNTADSRFGSFRQTLDAEMQCLHAKGLGTKKKQAEPITSDEEAPLWTTGQLECGSAQAPLIVSTFTTARLRSKKL